MHVYIRVHIGLTRVDKDERELLAYLCQLQHKWDRACVGEEHPHCLHIHVVAFVRLQAVWHGADAWDWGRA